MLVTCLGLTAQAATAATRPIDDWIAFFGPFHVIFLHYPIGFLTLAALLDLWTIRNPSQEARRAVGITLGLAATAAWVAGILGLCRSARGEFDGPTLELHRNLGIAVALLGSAAWATHRWLYRPTPGPAQRIVFRGILAVSLLVLVAAGHLGGNLTHGSNFLTENAPPTLERWLGKKPDKGVVSDVGNQTSTYVSTIQPILSRKCYSCHGPEKQKGHLRLDNREAALKGGVSGEPSIVPQDPTKSRLVKSILLPRSHDDAMPPEGKEGLTDQETIAIIHWIQDGADFGNPSPVTK